MSKEQLQGLIADVDRLLVAGGTTAAGDEKLRRREPVLRELGQKVPVLGQVAEAVKRVSAANPAQATPALLDLLLVTQQLRFSLAAVGTDGTLEPVEKSGPWTTNAVSRDLYPVLETLTGGAGRLDVLRDAVARGVSTDLRLLDPLLKALGDGYDELADEVATKALPAFGRAIIPDLQRGLKLDGKKVDARRLVAICKIDPKVGARLSREALTNGSPSLQEQALYCLAEVDPNNAEPAALELIALKPRQEVYCAALAALASSKDDAALDALVAALASGTMSLWSQAMRSLTKLPHPGTTKRLLAAVGEGQADLESLRSTKSKKPAPQTKTVKKGKPPKSEAAAQEQARDRLCRFLKVLGERRDAKAVETLLPLLQHAVADVREAAADALVEIGQPAGVKATAELLADAKVWRSAVRAAWKLPAREHFDLLAPLCEGLAKAKGAPKERGEYVLERFEDGLRSWEEEQPGAPASAEEPRSDYDSRWGPLLLKLLDSPQRASAAIGLGQILGKKAIPELMRVLEASVKKGECAVVEALGRARARQAIEPMVQLMPRQQSHHYCVHDALRMIGDPSAIAPLKELLDQTKDQYRRTQIEAVIVYLEKLEAKE